MKFCKGCLRLTIILDLRLLKVTGNKNKIILKPTQVFKNKLSEEPLIRNSAKLMCDCLPQT